MLGLKNKILLFYCSVSGSNPPPHSGPLQDIPTALLSPVPAEPRGEWGRVDGGGLGLVVVVRASLTYSQTRQLPKAPLKSAFYRAPQQSSPTMVNTNKSNS